MVLALLLLVLSEPPTDLAAVGIVSGKNPAHTAVVLQSGSRTRVALVGETAFGGKVLAIGPRSVTLDYDGRRVELRLQRGAEGPRAAAAPAPAPDPATRSMSRADLEKRLGSEMGRIMTETAVSSVSTGSVKGVVLNRVPQGSLLTDAGLQAGDIITEVDGVAIDSPVTLLSLYPKLQTESQFQAVVMRNGQPVTLTLSVR
jgi:type II secretion system protein C